MLLTGGCCRGATVCFSGGVAVVVLSDSSRPASAGLTQMVPMTSSGCVDVQVCMHQGVCVSASRCAVHASCLWQTTAAVVHNRAVKVEALLQPVLFCGVGCWKELGRKRCRAAGRSSMVMSRKVLSSSTVLSTQHREPLGSGCCTLIFVPSTWCTHLVGLCSCVVCCQHHVCVRE